MVVIHQKAALVNVQYLRAAAALMVVWVHAREQFVALEEYFPSMAGLAGVDLFFVISGFIMVYATHDKKIAPHVFIARRFLRVAPMYWLGTSVLLSVAMVAPNLMKSTLINWPHVVASFLFIPAESPKFPSHYWPLLIPGWTLNYEMAFYVAFGLLLFVKQSWRVFALSAFMVGVVAIGGIFWNAGALGFYSNAIILEFALGALIGYFYCNHSLKGHRGVGMLFCLLGFGLWMVGQNVDLHHRLIGAGLPAALILIGACMLPNFNSSVLGWLGELGDASYSIYICHVFVLGVVRVLWGYVGLPFDDIYHAWSFMGLSIVSSAIVGWGAHRLLEQPINQALQKKVFSLKAFS